jgi:hypothetical protein
MFLAAVASGWLASAANASGDRGKEGLWLLPFFLGAGGAANSAIALALAGVALSTSRGRLDLRTAVPAALTATCLAIIGVGIALRH